MSDPIGEWVDAALRNGPTPKVLIDRCPNCRMNWHGLPFNGCPGSHIEGANVEFIHDYVWNGE